MWPFHKSVDSVVKEKAEELAWKNVVEFYQGLESLAKKHLNDNYENRKKAIWEIALFLSTWDKSIDDCRFIPGILLDECIHIISKKVVNNALSKGVKND
jgi:hypothetical protein